MPSDLLTGRASLTGDTDVTAVALGSGRSDFAIGTSLALGSLGAEDSREAVKTDVTTGTTWSRGAAISAFTLGTLVSLSAVLAWLSGVSSGALNT